jgi:N-sulfoglucosamine sulfohydrolase
METSYTNKKRRPNVLMVVVHDIGTSLGCYGNSDIKSPCFDTFASEGVRFDSHFGTAPICSPSRGSIVTGKYPHVNGLMGLVNIEWNLPEFNKTDAMLFRENEYETTLFGYQHEVKDPKQLGFEKLFFYKSHSADAVTDMVVEYLDNEYTKDRPLYARVGFFDTHRMEKVDNKTGKKLFYDWHKYRDRAPLSDDISIPEYMEETETIRGDLADFYGSVNFVDENFGRILDALERNKMSEDTIVIFTTDHGIDFPRAKSSLYDPGINTTLLMRWPEGFTGGRVINEMTSHIDILPTLLESCDIKVPQDIQGKSFLGLLKDGQYNPNEIIFAEKNTDPSDIKRCIRTKDWKLIHNYNKGPLNMITRAIEGQAGVKHPKEGLPEWELYDLKNDRLEFNNLSGRKEYEHIEDELKRRLHKLQEETKDPVLTGMMCRPLKEAETWLNINKTNYDVLHFDE